LLELIRTNPILVDGEQVKSTRTFQQKDLIPEIGYGNGIESLKDQQRRLIRSYHTWKSINFTDNLSAYNATPDDFEFLQLMRITKEIGERIGKSPQQLTDEEIEDHYNPGNPNPFGNFNFSELYNRYLLAWHTNRKNMGLAQMGYPIKFFTPEEFLTHYGPPPWQALNEVVGEVFNGKFQFPTPDLSNRTYQERAILLENKEFRAVNQLSTGEQTILWLALIIVNIALPSDKSDTSPRLFLFDEPDAFLHPQMVLQMYKTFNAICSRFNIGIVFTTHSPTTAALAPAGALFRIANGKVDPISNDTAIAELLDGVPQISIDPNKRRQVFVESFNDAFAYQNILTKIRSKCDLIDPSISLNFVSSGDKIPTENIEQIVKKHLPKADVESIRSIAISLNGLGSSSRVLAQVESMTKAGSKTTRGLLDWDKKNRSIPEKGIFVTAEGVFYSFENWSLDPIGILALLNKVAPQKYPLSRDQPDLQIDDWLESSEKLQISLDHMIFVIHKTHNAKDAPIKYLNGITLLSDQRHTTLHGHSEVEQIVANAFPELARFIQAHPTKNMSCAVIDEFMLYKTNGDFIPLEIVNALARLQNS